MNRPHRGLLWMGYLTVCLVAVGTSFGNGRSDSPRLRWAGNGHLYQVIDSNVSWSAAKADAQARGGHLVTITSAREQAWIKRTFVDGNGTHGSLWIGLYQDQKPARRAWPPDARWHWLTGEALVYANWSPDQPDDWWSSEEDNQENYGEMWVNRWASLLGKQAYWNDLASTPPSGWQPDGHLVEWDRVPPDPGEVPLLSWTGRDGFAHDGVDPNIGTPGKTTYFEFRVSLTDPDGDEPDYVRVVVRRNGQHWVTRPMWPQSSVSTSAGRIYARRLSAPFPPGKYTYLFRARDEDGFARGTPTRPRYGPSMRPELAFVQAPGYSDGVEPNFGFEGLVPFLWKVIYRDNDGDPPEFIRVVLWRNDRFYDVFQMITQDPSPDPMAGVEYRARRALRRGTYEYKFEADDRDGRAVGPPAARRAGIRVVRFPIPFSVTSLAAVPTPSGAQINLTLSSEAQVEARVLNMAGRQVRTLCRARECAAGSNTLVWNAQSDTGVPVPSGVYLVEVTAQAEDGGRATAVTRVTVRR